MTNIATYEDNELVNVRLQEADGLLFVHVDVKTFSKTVFEYIQVLWEQLQLEAYFEGWDDINFCTRNHKFISMVDPDFTLVTTQGDISVYNKRLEF